MNPKKRGLGRGLSDLGLSELLGDLQAAPLAVVSNALNEKPSELDHQFKTVSIHQLKPGPYQPRKFLSPEGLEELANSIRKQGVIQPIVVRKNGENSYEIIAGERRWRAAQMAELTVVPVMVRDISDEAAMAMALIENIQRRDLNAMEEAQAMQRLIDEFNMTHQEVADAVGKSRVNVTNLLRLLKLNRDVQALVEQGHLDMGHARALLMIDIDKQSSVANMIVARALSVRETEEFIRKMMSDPVPSSKKFVLNTIQDRLMQKLGMKVSVVQNAKGRGKLIIKYNSETELEKVIEKFF